MEEIRDCTGRIACKANATTGFVEVSYKRCKTSTQIPIGGVFTIERENVITLITRINDAGFNIKSFTCAA